MPDDRRDPDRPDDGRHAGRRKTDKIACPRCGCLQSTVTKSTPALGEQIGDGYWRRRECFSCHKRFTTEEVIRGVYAQDSEASL